MRIITISRQFGSGGRELGKRLSDVTGYDYYDKEIITALAAEEGLHPDNVQRILSSHGWSSYPLNYGSQFRASIHHDSFQATELLVKQRRIIEKIAKAGNDCIIVGRDADIILADYSPLRISICADFEERLARCMRFEEKKPADEQLTKKQVASNIKRIDRERKSTREVLTGKQISDSSTFDLTINTGKWNMQSLAEAVADFSGRWFRQENS
ncbi:MAG: cytidylate kinase-like family protein [Catonella sp.]|nr:cytidylate kinase-like family protein [Catonella sp.]MDY6357869.1 cytidylate kinase-like family protein [Catonella sp.]